MTCAAERLTESLTEKHAGQRLSLKHHMTLSVSACVFFLLKRDSEEPSLIILSFFEGCLKFLCFGVPAL